MKATKAWNLLTIQIGNLEKVIDTYNDIGFHAYAQNLYAISCVKKKFLRFPNYKMSTRFLFSKMSWSSRNHSDRKFSENI